MQTLPSLQRAHFPRPIIPLQSAMGLWSSPLIPADGNAHVTPAHTKNTPDNLGASMDTCQQ
jgi:hypothetical protein